MLSTTDRCISLDETIVTSQESSLQLPRSAERSLSLLDHVVTSGRCTLTEAAEAADLPVSTTLRHLLAMQKAGFLDRDASGVFSAGPEFLRLAFLATSTGPHARLAEAARPHLRRLTNTTEESTYLAIRDGSMAVYTACVEGTRAVRHVGWVGHTVPLTGSAVGVSLTTLDRSGPPAVRTGVVEPDVTAVAAPIFGDGPAPLAAISVIGPSGRLTADRLAATIDAVSATRMAIEAEITDPAADTAHTSPARPNAQEAS